MRFRHPQGVIGQIPRLLKQHAPGFRFHELCVRRCLAAFGALGRHLGQLDLGLGRFVLGGLGLTLTLDPMVGGRDTLSCRARTGRSHLEQSLRVGHCQASGLERLLFRPGRALRPIKRCPRSREFLAQGRSSGLSSLDPSLTLCTVLFSTLNRAQCEIPPSLAGLEALSRLLASRLHPANFGFNRSQHRTNLVILPLPSVYPFTQIEVRLALSGELGFKLLQGIGGCVEFDLRGR